MLEQYSNKWPIDNTPPFPHTDDGFYWADGSPFQYEKWNLGEPNFNGDDDEDCASMYIKGHDRFHWYDERCNSYNPFMCKVEQGKNSLIPYNVKTAYLSISWWDHIFQLISCNKLLFEYLQMVITWYDFGPYAYMWRYCFCSGGYHYCQSNSLYTILTLQICLTLLIHLNIS